jgi:hypothetical protein
MIMNNGALILRLATLAALLAAPAAAQEAPAPGLARSTSFSAYAPGAAIAVRPLDNTRANLALKQRFASALTKRSVRVQEMPAPLVLNFETEVDQTIRRNIPTRGTAAAGNDASEVRVDIWPSHRDSTSRLPDRGMLRYLLIATLDDERTGRRVWQGEATYSGAPADESETLAAMAEILVDQLGRTVRQRSFRIE